MMWITHLDGGPKRVNHAAVAVDHKIYSFGGYCTGENSREYTSMDVHVLNTNTLRWTKHPVSDLPYFENDDILPYKRYGHTAVLYGDKIYIWGGRNDFASDGVLFCFDTTWHCWTAPKTTGNLPLPRDGHTACLWRHYMIIFGGYEEETEGFADNVYILDLELMRWSFVNTNGKSPSLRDFHTAICLNDRMYLFGGRDTSPTGQEIYSNTIWYLDLHNFTWYAPCAVGDIPTGRRSHSAFVYHGNMYIFGGYNTLREQHFNDMYRYDPSMNQWTKIEPLGVKPCERRRQACVLVGNKLYLFGGTSPQSLYGNLHAPGDKLIDHSDMHVLDFAPTLRTLCILTVRKFKLDESSLPNSVCLDIRNISTPNKITQSRPSNSAG